MYYVYRFLDKSKNIIYVGKSKQELEQRLKGHSHLPDECYNLVYKIEYIECSTESDMSIKEIYYINKYRNNHLFFNVLDMTDLPESVEFNDKWRQYKGPLEANFSHSINYIKGYTKEKEVRYNKDGTIDQRKPNKVKGADSYVEGFTNDEVNLIIDYLVSEVTNSANSNQRQIRFRNLVMFVLGVNLPLKPNDFLELKYKDLFDKNDQPKDVTLKLGRFHKDEVINLPLRGVVKRVLTTYTTEYNLSYQNSADESLFQSRKHQVVSSVSWGRILKEAAKAVGIQKNIGAESVRKTYGLNIFERSANKYNALLFLGELWGQTREGQIIKYLNLTDREVDFEYYLGEHFALGNVDLSKIYCLNSTVMVSARNLPKPMAQKTLREKKQLLSNECDGGEEKAEVSSCKKYKICPPKIKLEIVIRHLEENISTEELADEYSVREETISNWISVYKRHGESALDDKWRK